MVSGASSIMLSLLERSGSNQFIDSAVPLKLARKAAKRRAADMSKSRRKRRAIALAILPLRVPGSRIALF